MSQAPDHRGKGSATGILRSFVGQLLTDRKSAEGFQLDFIDKEYLRRIRTGDFETLRKLFVRLLLQLATHKVTVFCFIDSITYLEILELREDTDKLLATLRRQKWVTPDCNMVFKLLVTDGQATSYAYKHFEGSEVIEMNRYHDGNDDNTLNLG
ncbi:hypothetical protein F5Y17DRAFT_434894 [Xylariaceae sp. FL0594]|nr:hypothetical protein F5Y17DRAFT_434894 [Xylariaceae sp. FL0594]